MTKSVLVVDDEDMIRRSLRLGLEGAGYHVTIASSGKEALALLESEPPDCAVVDLRLGDLNGLEILRAAKTQRRGLPVLIITAHGDVESAVAALRAGAFDFIKKPFDLEEVIAAVHNALHVEALEGRVAYLSAQADEREGQLVYTSPAMARVMEQVELLARQPVPLVLVLGESGTGKELVARALHQRSPRAAGPFIDVNCSALPEHLVESELFGHERGAFSDAREQKRGLVELAEGGTLFLDEIGDLAAPAQAKLLKFVETREFRRVGGTKQLSVDCRIVAATHRDLATYPGFRRDLYFRLAGVTVQLPPLKAREGDILLLARHFLAQFEVTYRKRLSGFTQAAERLLLEHRWPGNVRELRAAIAYAVLTASGGAIGVEHLRQVQLAAGEDIVSLTTSDQIRTLAEIETAYCRRVVELCGGNKQQAAQLLGIARGTLARKLDEDSVAS